MVMNRIELLRENVPTSSKILEIGPLCSPIFPKREGYCVFNVDHTDQAGLVAKYAPDHNVDTSAIEPVDFIWNGGSIADAAPADQHGTFDVFVASHVIEHST